MVRDTPSIQDSPPETLIVFDCWVPGARARLDDQRCAWGNRARVEMLAWRVYALIVRPGGATELAR